MRVRHAPALLAVVALGCASFRVDPESVGGGDALLTALETGVASLRGGDGVHAAELLDGAYWLNESRVSRSVSAGAAALLTSDLALPYRPSRTEMALLHYYGARAWLAQGRADEAAVDARRLSALLARLEENEQAFAPDVMASLHDVAAAVYAVAGEWEDAAVAARLRDRYRGTEQLAVCDSCGELVVIAEAGRVTRRVSRSLSVAVTDRDFAAVAAAGDGGESVAAAILAVERAMTPRYCGWSHRAVCGWRRHDVRPRGESFTFVHVAWPELAAPRRGGGVVLDIGGETLDIVGDRASGIGGNVSEAVAEDFSRDAPARLARAIGRTVARQALKKAGDAAMDRARDDGKKKRNDKNEDDDDDDSKGWMFAGVAAYVLAGASTLAERADTRSWRTLPDEIVVQRIALPAGDHVVRQNGEVIAEVTMVPRGVAIVFAQDR